LTRRPHETHAAPIPLEESGDGKGKTRKTRSRRKCVRESFHVHSQLNVVVAAADRCPCGRRRRARRSGAESVRSAYPADDRRPARPAAVDMRSAVTCSNKADTAPARISKSSLKDDARFPTIPSVLAQELIRPTTRSSPLPPLLAARRRYSRSAGGGALATQAKIRKSDGGGTSIIPSFGPTVPPSYLSQSSTIIATGRQEWHQKVLNPDVGLAPGNDALNFFRSTFTAGGGQIA